MNSWYLNGYSYFLIINPRSNFMNILFLTTNRFTDGSAGSTREIVLGKLLQNLGHKIFYITLADTPFGEVLKHENFEYLSLKNKNKSIFSRILNHLNYKTNFKRLLYKDLSKKEFGYIFITDIPINAINFIIKYARKKKIGLVHNSVEWYSPTEFKYGIFSLNYVLKYLLNVVLIRPPFKCIGISSFLTEHFSSRGIPSLRIPFIVDTENTLYKKRCPLTKFILLYAGSPGKKDSIKEMIEGLSLLNESQLKNIEFRIFGVSYNSLINNCNVNPVILKKLDNYVKIYGKVPINVIHDHLQEAHFTVLLRPEDIRYAKAGFPTKVSESLASGTPVILNLTSDLGLYIKDGVEGLIVPFFTAEAFAATIQRALLLSPDELFTMQINARKCAEDNLDYHKFLKKMESFLAE